MSSVYPVATHRISESLLRERLLWQFAYDRTELLKLQDQLSTGYRISVPSQDPPAATRAIAIQRLLEQKSQAKVNLQTSSSYISASDNALNGASELLANIRARALEAVDSTTSDEQRGVLAQEIQRALEQFVELGNRQFRGRYLFAGSSTSVRPYEPLDDYVVYRGNEQSLQSFVDVGLLLDTNTTGQDVFGGVSAGVQGRVDVNPLLTEQTRLADLRGGQGIHRGSFELSDGTNVATVDISAAETLRDVARAIEAAAPPGRQIVVRLSATGLRVDLDDAGGGSLTIRDFPGGTAAAELGIVASQADVAQPFEGGDLNPRLTSTTRLSDILGSRAQAVLLSAGGHNDLVIESVQNGDAFNDVQVRFVSVAAAGDQALVSYDPVGKTLDIDVTPLVTTANTVVEAINASGVFTAHLDAKLDVDNNGSGVVEFAASVTTAGGSGEDFDPTSGIQLVNKDQTFTITFEDAETIEDVLNILNASGADVLAEINSQGTGLDVRSRVSGADFAIGENGGTTAQQLGIRTLTEDTLLADLNYGRGVAAAEGTDFVIQRKDGTLLAIDISSAVTVGDVLDAINDHPDNVGNPVVARLTEYGNGIELYDENNGGASSLTVTRAGSFAAWDLGLIQGREQEAAASPATRAAATLSFPPPNDLNTALRFTAAQAGFAGNGIDIEFQDVLVGDLAVASFDVLNRRLVVQLDATLTTANTVAAAVNAEGTFAAELDTSEDPTNDGTGIVGATGVVAATSGGAPETLASGEINPCEAKSVFNSLLRLRDALNDNEYSQIERSVAMLDDDFQRLTYARADLGARGRTMDTYGERLDREDVELRKSLSDEIDADIVQVISDLSARQVNMEATLRLVGRTLQMSLMDFL